MWSGPTDLSAVSMASLMHHLCVDYYTPNSERESERVGEIYLFILKEWRGGFMSYQSSCLFSAWWIMVRYLLILWKEEWRQSVTSFLSDCGYTRQPSSFTAPLPDATDADEIWQREVFGQNLAQKYTGWSVSPGHVTHMHVCLVCWVRGWSALFILYVLVSLLLKTALQQIRNVQCCFFISNLGIVIQILLLSLKHSKPVDSRTC